ncbi:MAG: 4Fe-4S binding protein [Lachnospiraceae bacterium]|nr:4Fe-4S binding protein [Lachnospiraceae bacterium]
MFRKEELKGADIEIEFCGYKLQSPFILSSGPLTYGAEGMIKGYQAGCGAVVTKTIRKSAAINPVHHMGTVNGDSLINCEKWADTDRQRWYEKEIPETVKAGAIVIGSVGHTLGEAMENVQDVERAGAHIIELVSYAEETLLPMLDYTKAHVQIPVICKLSGNWPDPVGTAARCLAHGADGLCAIDSIGPTLKIDINKARPEMMSADGYGWMTGAAMRPISMRINAEIARNHPELRNLYASGGVMSADDAIEYMMAGAMGAGVCTVGILKGVEYIEKMCHDLSERLAELGYHSIEEVNRAALPNFPKKEYVCGLDFHFQPYREDGKKKCVSCGKCVKACCYDARTLDFPEMRVDMDKCRSCGLCVDVCPTGALTADRLPQTAEDLERERLSKEFYETVK